MAYVPPTSQPDDGRPSTFLKTACLSFGGLATANGIALCLVGVFTAAGSCKVAGFICSAGIYLGILAVVMGASGIIGVLKNWKRGVIIYITVSCADIIVNQILTWTLKGAITTIDAACLVDAASVACDRPLRDELNVLYWLLWVLQSIELLSWPFFGMLLTRMSPGYEERMSYENVAPEGKDDKVVRW